MKDSNIMLLGLQRSGTTLACHLINKLSNAVALHEPLYPIEFKDDSPLEIINRLERFCDNQRVSLLENGTAISKTKQGRVPDNHMCEIDKETGKRIDIIDSRVLKLDKHLSNDFVLVVKHCAFFAGVLDVLVGSFKCYAVIRNPLSTLLSWNSLEFEVSNGYAPAAERFDSQLKNLLHAENDKYERQILLLTWYYNKIYENLPMENIIFYEDIISSSGGELSKIISEASTLSETLTSKNNNAIYDAALKPLLANKLLQSNQGGYLHFYTKKSIKEILGS